MKRMSLMGLSLAAVLVMGALAATSAFAEDTFEAGQCNKTALGAGAYGNSGCNVPGGEKKYEWTKGFIAGKTSFTSEKKGGAGELPEATLETVGLGHINCTNEIGTGQYTGLANVKEVIGEFTSCVLTGKKCNSTGQPEGHINTKNLVGETGIVKKSGESSAKDKMGTRLKPESGEFLAEFGCVGGLAKVEVKGSVIVEVKQAKMLNKATLKFSAKSGKQKPEKFENSAEKQVLFSNLQGGEFEQSGQTLTTIQKNTGGVKYELRVCRKFSGGLCEVK